MVTYLEGEGTDPQGYPWPYGVADPPRCRPGAPSEGAPAAEAGRAQGPDPGRRTSKPAGSGHRRPSGQDHPDGHRIPRGTSNPGDHGHEGNGGGRGLGAGAASVLPTSEHNAKRHRAAPPPRGPPERPSRGQRAPACHAMGRTPGVSVAKLRSEGVWLPIIVWMSAPPANAY